MNEVDLIPILYPLVAQAAGYVLEQGANTTVGNSVYAAAGWAAKKGVQALTELRTTDPDLNHHIQRSARKAHLVATQELVGIAIARACTRNATLSSDVAELEAIQTAIASELQALPSTLPETKIDDAYLLLLNESTAAAEQLAGLKARQTELLQEDVRGWLGTKTYPTVIDDLLRDGWNIELKAGGEVDRDWHDLVAISFMQELKEDGPTKKIFDSQILAELKNRDLAVIANVDGLQQTLDKVWPTIQRIELLTEGTFETVTEILDRLRELPGATQAAIHPIEQALNQFAAEFGPTQTTISNLNRLLALQQRDLAKANYELRQWISKYKSLEQQLESLADDEGDLEFQSARDQLDRGDLSGAGDALRRLIDRLERREQALTKKRAAALSKLAQVHELEFEWDQAVATRERAVAICPDDTELRFGLAYLLDKQRQHPRAIEQYKKLIEQTDDEASRAGCLNNLANLYSATNRLDLAEKAFDEALRLYRALARGNPDIYRPYVATTLNNLANLYTAANRLDLAETAYDEALKLRRDLARSDPDTYRPDVAMALNNLANLYSDTSRLDLAEQAFDKALNLYLELARGNPNAYESDIAMTLNNLALLYSDTNRLGLAEKCFQEALNLYRELANINPDAYQPYVAMTLSNLAVLYNNTYRLNIAEQAVVEAITLLEPFYQANPGGRGDSWAKSHWLLARVQQQKGDCIAAVETVGRTREIVGWERYGSILEKVEEECGQ